MKRLQLQLQLKIAYQSRQIANKPTGFVRMLRAFGVGLALAAASMLPWIKLLLLGP